MILLLSKSSSEAKEMKKDFYTDGSNVYPVDGKDNDHRVCCLECGSNKEAICLCAVLNDIEVNFDPSLDSKGINK